MEENELGTAIVDCAVHLHQDLGPGLLETVYEVRLPRKLQKRGLSIERQVPIPIEYEGQRFEEGCHADLIVERKVIVELGRLTAISELLSVSPCLCENQKDRTSED
jgi:GxxExxY protein